MIQVSEKYFIFLSIIVFNVVHSDNITLRVLEYNIKKDKIPLFFGSEIAL